MFHGICIVRCRYRSLKSKLGPCNPEQAHLVHPDDNPEQAHPVHPDDNPEQAHPVHPDDNLVMAVNKSRDRAQSAFSETCRHLKSASVAVRVPNDHFL
jgi:hypothetical protein